LLGVNGLANGAPLRRAWALLQQRRGMAATGGTSVVVDEPTLVDANQLARQSTGVAVSHTGSAGLAGLLELRRDGVIAAGARVGLLFTGVQR
jgi:threonine synthase